MQKVKLARTEVEMRNLKIYPSKVGTKDGVRSERTWARSFKLGLHQSFSPHPLPILIQRELKSEHFSLVDGVYYKYESELYL